MIKLSDFFAPLGLINLTVFFAFLASCEIIGFSLARVFIKKIPDFLRGAIWILGLGLVIFLYFLSHFFVPFAFPTIVFCLLIPLFPSIRIYLRKRGWQTIIPFLRKSIFPLVLFLPLLPWVFIKGSLPPYSWDEMAYHYISPASLYFERGWWAGVGFHENLPRFLETAYIALFSLTKTFAVARLLHLSVFIAGLLVIYHFLKNQLGQLASIIFFALILFYGENLLFKATLGYIDVGTASLAMIGIICFLDFFLERKSGVLIIGLAFWGLAAGAKYSSLIPLASCSLIILSIIIKERLFQREYLKAYFVGFFLFLLLGGYWYLKNLVYTLNPIYPFFFKCQLERCYQLTSIGNISFSFSNIKPIFLSVLGGSHFLLGFFLISLSFILFSFKKSKKKIFYFLGLMIVLETFFARHLFKFSPRFFYHWSFLSMILVVLPISRLSDYKGIIRKFFLAFTVLLIIFTIYNSTAFIIRFYKEMFKPGGRIEIQYALRKLSIYQWVEKKIPKTKEVVFWCDEQLEKKELVVFDPSLTWYSYDGLFNVFLTNCKTTYISLLEEAEPYLKMKDLWVVSLEGCNPELRVEIPDSVEPRKVVRYQLKDLNNQIVCRSEKVGPALYRFRGFEE